MSKPTPRPWKIEHDEPYEMSLRDADDQKVKGVSLWLDDAPVPDFNAIAEANAAHIVKCVNMHDELVCALNGTLAALRLGPHVDVQAAIDYGTVVLLNAKAEAPK